MKLLLLRHGEASFDAERDFDRTLTDAGQVAIRLRAQQILDFPMTVEKTLVSPYIRTLETAELVEAILGPSSRIVDDAFVPDASPAHAASAVVRLTGEYSGPILVITHQPLITDLIKFLTHSHQPMAPGDMVLIDTPAIAAGFGEIECVF